VRTYELHAVARSRVVARLSLVVLLLLGTLETAWPQLVGTLFRRVSKLSNFEFTLLNDGTLWGDVLTDGSRPYAHWPRGTSHMIAADVQKGLAVLVKKESRYLVSDAGFMRARKYVSPVPFNKMVPGWIGDPNAPYDPDFQKAGWRYIDDPNFIVYSSLDYDSSGVDTSGSNFYDWPIRLVGGQPTYVTRPLDRRLYPPIYRSDEDLFCIYKDTDARANQLYAGPNGASMPVGLEFQLSVYTWAADVARDMVLFVYGIINKSDKPLDSCYIVFSPGLILSGPFENYSQPYYQFREYEPERLRNLTYVRPLANPTWLTTWKATPYPPTIGYPILESPRGYGGAPLGLTRAIRADTIQEFVTLSGQHRSIFRYGTDSIVYSIVLHPAPWDPSIPYSDSINRDPVILSGPFRMLPGDTARYAVGIIFADSLARLLVMDDYLRRVYASGFQRPVPPPAPNLQAYSLDRAVRLVWDRRSESAVDPIIPDSLGKPFQGYRLLRAPAAGGPFLQIGRWVRDSTLAHEYIDRGLEIGGLKDNVRYYYQLLAFDEGSTALKLPPMECAPVEGVNSLSAVPGVEAANAVANGGETSLEGGILGDVTVLGLVPRDVTRFNGLLSGRELKAQLSATCDTVQYQLQVVLTDTLGGRAQTYFVNPNLMIHGSPTLAGLRDSTVRLSNLFGLGAADVELHYRFEQLDARYHIEPAIMQSGHGVNVPVIVQDSLNVTGIRTYSPYTSDERDVVVEFGVGGLDTVDLGWGRIFPYLTVRVFEPATGTTYQSGTEYTFIGTAILGKTYSAQMKPNRYYLTDTLANGQYWEFAHTLALKGSVIGFDYPDRGRGNGKPGAIMPWASGHRMGTVDFVAGDRVQIQWRGGVRASFPKDAVVRLVGGERALGDVSQGMLENVKIVPNPYLARHEAQRESPVIYFNNLPEECTIRIYTVSLDRVKVLEHRGGSREEWDLKTEGGELVASQMLLAHIEASNGLMVVKKFAVVMGK